MKLTQEQLDALKNASLSHRDAGNIVRSGGTVCISTYRMEFPKGGFIVYATNKKIVAETALEHNEGEGDFSRQYVSIRNKETMEIVSFKVPGGKNSKNGSMWQENDLKNFISI